MQYKPENKTCQNCKHDFIIEPEDFLFYEKIKVPPPTWCPECRMYRRMIFGNLNSFYKKECESCGELVIGLYPTNGDTRMYCNPCWWKDNWDGTEYGMDYDESRPFFEQLIELRKKSIFVALESLYPSLVNTKYTNNASYQKNCFMTIYADYDEHCAYIMMSAHDKDLLDCYRSKESELCYECVGIYKCYNCKWSEEIDSCVNCSFCQSCYGCNNCIGCVNLRNKSYYIFNKKYSKEEYVEKIKEFNLDTHEGQQILKKQSEDFWVQNPKRSYHGNSLNINVTGEYVYESKNTKESFLVSGAEDCKYVQYLSLKGAKDCFDYTGWGADSSLLYECYIVGEGAYNNRFSSECWPNAMNIEYSYYCVQGKDCFGCVNLKRKQYCILNKQYTKEEYFKLKDKILTDMKNNPWKDKAGNIYTYGEFLPPELSPYGYNETMAYEYNPLTKEEAKSQGYNWTDTPKQIYNFTLTENSLPETFLEINQSIKNEVINCNNCEKGFNISDVEYELLEKLNQPIPHACPKCRHNRRFNRTNKPGLYDRVCSKCGNKIKTPYAPERPEIIYCEKCYQQETE
jgi:CxxC-x17-CxxC domain-containing protein